MSINSDILFHCADSPGYIKAGEAPNTDQNVAHFRQVLQKYSVMGSDKTSVAWWLVKQTKQVSSPCPCVFEIACLDASVTDLAGVGDAHEQCTM